MFYDSYRKKNVRCTKIVIETVVEKIEKLSAALKGGKYEVHKRIEPMVANKTITLKR
jgi:hypothetical protein